MKTSIFLTNSDDEFIQLSRTNFVWSKTINLVFVLIENRKRQVVMKNCECMKKREKVDWDKTSASGTTVEP